MTLPITGGPEWAAAQSTPWFTVNEALRYLDAFAVKSTIQDRDLTAPPGTCADGARYLIAASPTGLWAGQAGKLAIALGVNATNGWLFVTVAVEGTELWVRDEDILIRYDGSAWVEASSGGGGSSPKSLMLNTRYLRLFIENTSDPNFCSISEIYFRDDAGSLIAGGTASASSQFSGTYSANKARDGNTATWWGTVSGSNDPCWWAIDFGSSKFVSEIELMPVSGSPTHMPTAVVLQTSSDGAKWYNVQRWVPAAWSSGVSQGFEVAAFTRAYRFGGFFTTTPTASEVLLIHALPANVTFPDNFAGSVGHIETNPTSSFVMNVQVNGSSVGTITVSTGGAFTFNTAGGAVSLVVGDRLKIVAPATPDATAALASFTLVGEVQ
jgi:hypothetical protein